MSRYILKLVILAVPICFVSDLWLALCNTLYLLTFGLSHIFFSFPIIQSLVCVYTTCDENDIWPEIFLLIGFHFKRKLRWETYRNGNFAVVFFGIIKMVKLPWVCLNSDSMLTVIWDISHQTGQHTKALRSYCFKFYKIEIDFECCAY